MNNKKKTDEIMRLERKRRKVGLNKSEERKYCKLNSELTGLPKKLFTKKFQDKMDAVISSTDKLLKVLKK